MEGPRMENLLATSWKLIVLRGAIAIVFGIVAIAWPISTAISLAVLWGFWAFFDGVGLIAAATARETPSQGRLVMGVMGVIALIAAFYGIFSPAVTAVTLTWILGIWLIVRGVFDRVRAFVRGHTHTQVTHEGLVTFLKRLFDHRNLIECTDFFGVIQKAEQCFLFFVTAIRIEIVRDLAVLGIGRFVVTDRLVHGCQESDVLLDHLLLRSRCAGFEF